MPNTVIDNRTGLRYEIPVHQGAIRTMDLRTIRTTPDDFGILGYDPASMNTASCQSAITFIDGDKGVLRYRGYGIDTWPRNAVFSKWPICFFLPSCLLPLS